MPIHEFYCKANRTIYSFYSPRILREGEVPRCPDNRRYVLKRMISGFSITGRHKDKNPAAPGEDGDATDDPRMEAAMAELEREMSSMDEENPDPRQMGHLMRRMSEITGESLDGPMEEMVRKMEEGMDPEALEEDFGDAMEDPDMGSFGDSAGEGEEAARKKGLRDLLARARAQSVRRDPELYDIREYL